MSVRAKWLGVIFLLVAGPALAEERIEWQTDIAKAVKQAKEEKKLVLVHFYTDTCAPCRVVEEKVFPEPRVVQSVMRNYVPVKINLDKEEKLAARYAIRQIPTDVFLVGGTGQEAYRAVTKETAAEYVTLLDSYAIQTGIGSARQAVLRERESRSDAQQFQNVEASPPAQQLYVQNQFAAPSNAGNNRYAKQGAAAAQSQVGEMAQAEVQTVYGGPASGSQPNQPQVGPYGAGLEQRAEQPTTVPGFAPQGGNRAPAAQPTMQRTNFQDPGDITTRPPIHTHFIPLKDIPPIGMNGYCPVSLREIGKWKRGDKRYGAIHRGRTYLFVSASEQQKFLADPDAYSPILSGADPVIFKERGELVEGNPDFGISIPHGDRIEIYFFANAESRERFEKNAKPYAANAHQAILKWETDRKLR